MAGAFGFDPSILMHEPSQGYDGQSLSDILGKNQDRQIRQAELGQMQYEQQRQRSLSDLVSQNANVYQDPAARAYALGGYGEQAAQAQAAAVQRQQAQIQMQESAAKLENIHRDLIASKLGAVKSQDDFDKIASSVPDEYGLKPGDENWQDSVKAFRQSRITPEQDAENNKTRFKEDAFGRVYDSFTGQFKNDDAPLSKGGGGGAVGVVSPSEGGLDILVEKAVRDGDMPKFGSGALGMKQRADFLNRMNELHPGADLASAHAQYRANMHNLTEATTQGGAQDVKENKALADIQVLRGTMKGLIDSRSPLINKVGRAFQQATGDPAYAAFRTAREMTLPTINSVVNSGQMSVGAREEVQDLLKKDDSVASMDKALGIIEQDMARSTEATHKRISNARSSISTLPGAPAPASAAHPDDSKAVKWARANPNDPMAAAILKANGVQ